MADELSLSVIVDYEKSTFDAFESIRDLLIDVAGERVHETVQNVGTTEEALALGDLSTGGYVLLRNHDTTNYVEVKAASGATPLPRLGPLEVALFRISPTASAPFVQANTAACNLQILLFEA